MCIAADKPVTPAKPPTASPAQKPAAKPAKAAVKPKISSRMDLEVAGITAETTDQFYGRLSWNRKDGPKQWFIKTGYGATVTRSYAKTKIYTTEVDTTTLDAQWRRDRKRTYNFITATANVRNRTPYTETYGDLTGYYMVSGGVGRKLMTGVEGEFALAGIHRYQEDGGSQIQPAYTIRLRSPITDAMTLDGESNFIQPFTDDTIVDSRLNLTYKFTPALSMRLTYVANNLLIPLANKTGWDRSFRISLVFSRATP
jgi:hypothetical protein